MEKLDVTDNFQHVTIILDGKWGLALRDTNGKQRLAMLKDYADVVVGGNGAGGDIHIYPSSATLSGYGGIPTDDASKATILLNGDASIIELKSPLVQWGGATDSPPQLNPLGGDPAESR